ncbi:MAG: FecCD family ABC transporter permease [Planctomycetota bacterium]
MLVLACFAALWVGSTSLGDSDRARSIVMDIRLPRILLAGAVGASLALAGVAAQSLFGNVLAAPHVVGVSSGSGLGAVLAMLVLAGRLGRWTVPAASMTTGCAVVLVVLLLARRGRTRGASLILAGIAVGAFCSALTSGVLYLADQRLQQIVFWLMGGFWRADWAEVYLMLPVMLVAGVALRLVAPQMNVLVLGKRQAADLGVNLRRLDAVRLVAVVVPTAVAVSLSGVVGFVGLIVPHLVRQWTGPDHRVLVPASALAGALLLVAADTAARTLAAPEEIPVGILTALVGAPVFLWLLQRRAALQEVS